ncbi:SusC/RagA family TonB-linked outer membrane protein [Rapidithrix thailandica]|uniref:SusC/RagA family TonB-linked outer membrane protein n=1 Tax=Rapidithrix thailandica TaxID=413964 RepID=A0AAW9RQP1_9BACT
MRLKFYKLGLPFYALFLRTGLVVLLLLSVQGLFAQGISLSGIVTDPTGMSLPGVSVVIKGTSKGTITDMEGKYTLQLNSENDVLIFSYVGFETMEVPVKGKSELSIVLNEETQELSEVVVTALGVEKEAKVLGYAVQNVEGKELVKARESDIMKSLTGKVAGLTVYNSTGLFEDSGVSLRGKEPLIVIDGIPNPKAKFWEISADDVANIDVLKGPTASALYGALGKDGAIMVTTKRGKEGKLSVDVNSSTMFQTGFLRIPEVQTTYGAGNNGQYAYVDGSGGGTEGAGWIWGPKLDQKDPSTPSGYFETPQFNSPVDPVTGERMPTPFLSRGKDNVQNFFRTGMISTNNVSVTGGNDRGNFRVSLSHMHQKGMVPNTKLDATTFTVSGGYKLAEKLKVDASLSYNKQYTNNFPERSYGPHNYLYNLVLWTGPDVDVRDLEDYWVKGKEGYQQKHYNNSWYNNPYFQAHEFLRGYHKDNTYGQMALTYSPSEDFEVLFRSGVNWHNRNRSYKEPKSYIRYSVVSKGNYELYNDYNFDLNTDLLATYKKQINQNFLIKASFGVANRYSNSKNLSIQTDGLHVTNFFNLSNSIKKLTGSNGQTDQKVNSIYGTLDFELFHSVFLTFTGRNDWISTLPVGNNSYFYPSVALSTVVSDLIEMPEFIDFFKVRGSWSQVSSGYITLNGVENPYNHIQAYNAGSTWGENASVYFPGTKISAGLEPETTDAFEVGMDLRVLNDRIGLDVTYYQMRDYNNLTTIPVSKSSGFTQRLINANTYTRKGVEVMLHGTPIKSAAFTWDVNLNWNLHRSYLKEAYDENGKVGNLHEGERADAIYTSVWQRSPEGEVIYGANGLPLVDSYVRKIGNGDPDWVYGLQNRFTYKNLSLNVSFDGRVGGKFYTSTNQKMYWGGTHPATVNQYRDDANEGKASYVGKGVVVTDGEVIYDEEGNITSDTRQYAENTTAVNYISWVRDYYDGDASEPGYYDATFLKLREVTLTYQLPVTLLDKVFIDRASISLVGRNLLLWSDMPNIDPDPGKDNLQTPSTRSFGFNIDLKF